MISLSDDKTTVHLSGACLLAEAELLQQHLAANRSMRVDWRDCTHAHTAVLQVLLAARPQLVGPPANAFLQVYMMELLTPMSA